MRERLRHKPAQSWMVELCTRTGDEKARKAPPTIDVTPDGSLHVVSYIVPVGIGSLYLRRESVDRLKELSPIFLARRLQLLHGRVCLCAKPFHVLHSGALGNPPLYQVGYMKHKARVLYKSVAAVEDESAQPGPQICHFFPLPLQRVPEPWPRNVAEPARCTAVTAAPMREKGSCQCYAFPMISDSPGGEEAGVAGAPKPQTGFARLVSLVHLHINWVLTRPGKLHAKLPRSAR